MTRKFIAIVLVQAVLLCGIIGYRHYWIQRGEKVLLRTLPVDPWDMFRGDYIILGYDISRITLTESGSRDAYRINDPVYVFLKKEPDNTFAYSGLTTAPPQAGLFIRGRVTNVGDEIRWFVTAADEQGQSRQFELALFYGDHGGETLLFCTNQSGQSSFRQFGGPKTPQCAAGDATFSGTVTGVLERRRKVLNIEYGIEHYFVEEGRGSVDELAKQYGVPSSNSRSLEDRSRLQVEAALRRDGRALISRIFIDGREVK